MASAIPVSLALKPISLAVKPILSSVKAGLGHRKQLEPIINPGANLGADADTRPATHPHTHLGSHPGAVLVTKTKCVTVEYISVGEHGLSHSSPS